MLAFMPTTRQLTITLPQEMADRIKAKVASGQYASESEAIRDSVQMMMDHDRSVEHWMRTEVVESIKAVEEGRARTYTVEEVQAHLTSLYKKGRTAKNG